MSLRDALQSIYDQRGLLTPALVVEEAKPADHPLHSRFEWDDNVAGHQYRLIQAQELIRSVKVVYKEATEDDPSRSVRAWVAVREDSRYEPVEKVAEDPVVREIVLRDMRREWTALHRRYQHFAEFSDMVQADLAAAAAATAQPEANAS